MHTWGKTDGPGGIRIRFVFTVVTLVIPVALILLALRPPEQILTDNGSPLSAKTFEGKVSQLEQAQEKDAPVHEVHVSADEISAALNGSNAKANETVPAVTFHDDLVTGQFVTEIARQKLYLTVSGRLGEKDGYVTFDPTDFKVGALSIPVSLVNPALQKKIEEQREQLKLPSFVADLRVQNGELVIRRK